ncbi:MAG: ThuA domain-containing protein, partial [Tepidisphaeraceae bacterium]
FRGVLAEAGFDVEMSETLESFSDEAKLKALDLIVPCWTCGTLKPEQQASLCGAVKSGVGIAGVHGGMCDAFRNSCEYQFMTGGQWVAHPGNDGVKYTVRITEKDHPIMKGIDDFEVKSEQYYLHVDPGIKVLATMRFPAAGVTGPHDPNGPVEMPTVWTKMYGKGRVFYDALGHQADIVAAEPNRTIMGRGFLWAARE